MRGGQQQFTTKDLHGVFMLVVEGNGKQLTQKLVLQ